MRLIYKAFVATSIAAISSVASAQMTQPGMTTQPSTTTQQPMPDEPATTAPTTAPGQTQTTPGAASQSTPAQTGATPSGQVVPATEADLKTGASVHDQSGGLVGKIESVSAKGVVLNTGKARVTIPASSFGKNDKGLAIAMTKDEIDAAAKKSSPKGR